MALLLEVKNWGPMWSLSSFKKLFLILSSNIDLPFQKKKQHRFHGSISGHTS
jgi:hypothetical protein